MRQESPSDMCLESFFSATNWSGENLPRMCFSTATSPDGFFTSPFVVTGEIPTRTRTKAARRSTLIIGIHPPCPPPPQHPQGFFKIIFRARRKEFYLKKAVGVMGGLGP